MCADTGARTPVAAIFASVIVAVVLGALTEVIQYTPKFALACPPPPF